MPSSKESPTLIPFGPFEVDLSSQELRKQGIRLRLPRQSFQILKMLLERPGELVTRDELHAALWPSDTFVDFEHGLNAAINRLREALGDAADNPRYVETLPRRGYRFIGTVETPAAVPETAEPQPVAAPPVAAKEESPAAAEPQRAHRRLWPYVISIGAICLVAIAVGVAIHRRAGPKLTEKDPIVLTDFTNSTGDPVFDDTLRQGLIVQLEQSPYLNVVPENAIQATLRFMGHKPGERLTMADWHEVCERSNSTTLLTGSIARLGRQYVIGLNAEECKTGRHLADEQVQVASKEEVLKGLGSAASSLRKKLGENVASLEKFDLPLEQVTTPSLEALQAYTRGQKTFDEKGFTLAIPFFERAIELDPNFAAAHEFLGVAYRNLGKEDLGRPEMEKAYALRDRASERERLLILSIYCEWILGDSQREIEILQMMAQTYPRASVAHLLLASSYTYFGRWTDAIHEEQLALRLDRASAVDYSILALCYLRLAHTDQAEKTLKEGIAHYPELDYFNNNLYELAFLRGDTGRMAQLVTSVTGKEYEAAMLDVQANTDAYYGQMARSRQFSRRAIELARESGSGSLVAAREGFVAMREAELENYDLARQHTDAALKEKPAGFNLAMITLALAVAGDSAKAETLCRGLLKDNPSNTLIREYWVPLVHAWMAIHRGDAKAALTEVEPAMAFNLGWGRLFPTYVRGEAFLQARDGASAVGEFQKVIEQPTTVVNMPYGPLARLGLARAYALQGNIEKARAAYQDFLSLWKEADEDAPILKQAQGEYAKLQ